MEFSRPRTVQCSDTLLWHRLEGGCLFQKYKAQEHKNKKTKDTKSAKNTKICCGIDLGKDVGRSVFEQSCLCWWLVLVWCIFQEKCNFANNSAMQLEGSRCTACTDISTICKKKLFSSDLERGIGFTNFLVGLRRSIVFWMVEKIVWPSDI